METSSPDVFRLLFEVSSKHKQPFEALSPAEVRVMHKVWVVRCV